MDLVTVAGSTYQIMAIRATPALNTAKRQETSIGPKI